MPDAELTRRDAASATPSVVRLRQLMSVALLAVFVYGFIEGRTYQPDAGRLPVVVCAVGAVFALLMLLSDFRRARRSPVVSDVEPVSGGPNAHEALGEILRDGIHSGDEALGLASIPAGMLWFAWIGLFIVLIAISGMLAASLIFVTAFLFLEATASWRATALSMVGLVLAVGFGSYAIGMNLPEGLLLQSRLGLDDLADYVGF